jgi:antirestriction protein ArdC
VAEFERSLIRERRRKGIPTDIPHHASYIANWIKPAKDDKREIFRAAADAQKIVNVELPAGR